jgi:YHS domain-containing protein
MRKDPVCSGEIDELDATQAGLTTDYMGRIYYFCSAECKTRFDAEPSTFAGQYNEWEEWDIPDRTWPLE